jgi:hypothetical protein
MLDIGQGGKREEGCGFYVVGLASTILHDFSSCPMSQRRYSFSKFHIRCYSVQPVANDSEVSRSNKLRSTRSFDPCFQALRAAGADLNLE